MKFTRGVFDVFSALHSVLETQERLSNFLSNLRFHVNPVDVLSLNRCLNLKFDKVYGSISKLCESIRPVLPCK